MRHLLSIGMTIIAASAIMVVSVAEEGAAKEKTKEKANDTLVVEARVVEIPGAFPPNDLYNYVYIMKYRVTEVLKGSYDDKEILVGHYNPLIPRKQVSDKMDKYVDGNVEKFEEGAKHKLTLIKPIDKVWQEALEDEYFDTQDDKYYALKAEKLK
ncbi:MAG: hypothetical protein GF401_12780 [Chitinivibrionales bacterium]|nr:hypothetical protein [Chitinivibrionales bacterium]